MPYIKSGDGRREALQKGEPALTAGELNYQIFYYVKHADSFFPKDIETIKIFIKQFLGEKPNYQRYNDMTGALVRCSKEIERRIEGINSHYYPRELIEKNYWHDNFWGVCTCGKCSTGKNHLGTILIQVREEIQKKSKEDREVRKVYS